MQQLLIDIAGWFPAIIFPAATFLQLHKIIKAGSAGGVSSLSWALFGLANLGAYVYTQKFFSLPAIIGFLGAALLDFAIVLVVRRYERTNEG